MWRRPRGRGEDRLCAARAIWARTRSTREIHDGGDALLEQPGVLHRSADFFGVFLYVWAVVVLVRCCIEVVFIRCFKVGAVE